MGYKLWEVRDVGFFEDILDVYFQLIAHGYEPARAKRIMDLYLEGL